MCAQVSEPGEGALGIGVLSYISPMPGDGVAFKDQLAQFWIQAAIPESQFAALMQDVRSGLIKADDRLLQSVQPLNDSIQRLHQAMRWVIGLLAALVVIELVARH